MTTLARKSKGFGFAGTLLAHGLVLLVCFFVVEEAVPTPLPSPVEALLISLTEPVAPREPSPEPVAEPEPAPPPEPEPQAVEDPIPVKKKVAEKPKKAPKEKPPRKEPVNPAPVQPAQAASRASAPDTSVRRQARQTLLSALVARIEKEKRYPTAARRLGIEGKVTAVVRVDASGQIVSIQVRAATAHAVLEKATQEALNRVRSKWKPVPVPEAMTLNIPIHYHLRS